MFRLLLARCISIIYDSHLPVCNNCLLISAINRAGSYIWYPCYPVTLLPHTIQEKMPTHAGNLLIISNRLPITIKKENDNYKYNVSSGGLVTGLSGLSKATRFQWFGWPGLEIPEEDVERVTRELDEKHDAVPVWLSDELADKHCRDPWVK